MNQALLWYVERIFRTQNRGWDDTSEEIRGIAASAALPRPSTNRYGRNEFGKLASGDVLVCPMTSPAWSVPVPHYRRTRHRQRRNPVPSRHHRSRIPHPLRGRQRQRHQTSTRRTDRHRRWHHRGRRGNRTEPPTRIPHQMHHMCKAQSRCWSDGHPPRMCGLVRLVRWISSVPSEHGRAAVSSQPMGGR